MGFDMGRLRRADWIVGVGAVALFVFMIFFDWYGGSAKTTTPFGGASFSTSSSSSGWDTFTSQRWIWLLAIIVALGAVVLVATQRQLSSPIQPSVLVAGLGALSTLFILYRIIHHPSGGASYAGASYSYGIKLGIWLGLIAAAAITYGGYLKMTEEGTSIGDVKDQASRAVSSFTESGSSSSAPPPASSSEPPLPPPASSSGDRGEGV